MIFTPPHLLDSSRWNNMRVGLLGGSFNPPHIGHIHISRVALAALRLDVIWWLVSPQNPLKNKAEIDFEDRFRLCREITDDCPDIVISDIENQLQTNLTWKTIRGLKKNFPKTEFVWITGMDNAQTMHQWENWEYILDTVPTAHMARPPAWSLIEACPLKMKKGQKHHFLVKGKKAPLLPNHTYWIMQNRMVEISSTEIRKQNNIS